MLADEFTDILPANKWENYLKQMGLVEQEEAATTVRSQHGEMQDRMEELVIENE
jgi:hypothetical protein